LAVVVADGAALADRLGKLAAKRIIGGSEERPTRSAARRQPRAREASTERDAPAPPM